MKKLDYKFKDQQLFELAMTQSGANATSNNERLEFLGDRVLGLSVAMLLFEMFPNETEGEMARRHAVLVSTNTLADVAKELGFDKQVRRGHMTGGRLNHILANATEAVFGAIFIDSGFNAASKVIIDLWRPIAAAAIVAPKDPKTALQELSQRTGAGTLPIYDFLEITGTSHAPVFNARVTVSGRSATGSGATKKAATAAAAAELLKILDPEQAS